MGWEPFAAMYQRKGGAFVSVRIFQATVERYNVAGFPLLTMAKTNQHNDEWSDKPCLSYNKEAL
jgi:hypothetical protein